jgi:hypothetical protein
MSHCVYLITYAQERSRIVFLHSGCIDPHQAVLAVQYAANVQSDGHESWLRAWLAAAACVALRCYTRMNEGWRLLGSGDAHEGGDIPVEDRHRV